MAGLLSKGITLGYKDANGDYVTLPNLQEIAELGNNAREKIDVTTLSDDAKKSIAGLEDTAQDLPFKFLYDKAEFEAVAALNESTIWCVTLPDGMKAYFVATPSVKLAGVGVSAPLTYTLLLSVESKIEWGKEPLVPFKLTLAGDGADYSGGTYTIQPDTTWGEFAPTANLIVVGDKISGGDGTGIFLLDSKGNNVKPTDVIVAGENYHWS